MFQSLRSGILETRDFIFLKILFELTWNLLQNEKRPRDDEKTPQKSGEIS